MNKKVVEKLTELLVKATNLNEESSIVEIVDNLDDCVEVVKLVHEDKEEPVEIKTSLKLSTLTQISKFRVMILGLIVNLADKKRLALEEGKEFEEETELKEASEAVSKLSQMEILMANMI